MHVEIITRNKDTLYWPVVIGDVAWSTERKGVPGKLTFTLYDDRVVKIEEGDVVMLRVDGKEVFYGFIFTKKFDKERQVSITAYDQLRYLKNKDVYSYSNKTASEVIKMIAADFHLKLGSIADTGYRIPSRVEDNVTLFDIIHNALDLTLTNRSRLYILYSDFEKLTLKSNDDMVVDLILDETKAENFDYSSSIDEHTYNKIKLVYTESGEGESKSRAVYVKEDVPNMVSWGVLQYFDTLQKNENGYEKAKMFLNLYNQKTQSLSISKAFGDLRVRAGSTIGVYLRVGDIQLKNPMLVEQCTHTFSEGEHFMNLKLRGRDIHG